MPERTRLDTFIRILRARDADTLTADERASLRFADLAEQPVSPPTGSRPAGQEAQWVWMLMRLDVFQVRHGRMPHDNNRRQRAVRDREELQLIAWIRYQRSPAKRSALCTWQRWRLEGVPGFAWAPRDESWWDDCRGYADFLASHGRAPVRAAGGHEAHLARWAERQRSRFRAGTLPPSRRRALESLPIWAWG